MYKTYMGAWVAARRDSLIDAIVSRLVWPLLLVVVLLVVVTPAPVFALLAGVTWAALQKKKSKWSTNLIACRVPTVSGAADTCLASL